MANVTIELTTTNVPALLAAIQQVSDDLSSIILTVQADDPVATATTVATEPTKVKVKRRQSHLGRHAELVYKSSGAGGRFQKIAVQSSLRRNGMTLTELMGTKTTTHTWQHSLKMAHSIRAGLARSNGTASAASL
jgi:hypothetical protein